MQINKHYVQIMTYKLIILVEFLLLPKVKLLKCEYTDKWKKNHNAYQEETVTQILKIQFSDT